MGKVVWGAVVLVAVLGSARTAAAQPLVFDQTQQITVNGPGFYPFDTKTNAAFKADLAESRSVGVWITNFSGTKLRIAPAADDREIGKRKKVKGNTTLALAFKKAHDLYGLSFVPSGTVSFTIMIQPFAGRPCASPVNCKDDCGGNLGKCCKKDASGNEEKICVQVGTSSCGCGKK